MNMGGKPFWPSFSFHFPLFTEIAAIPYGVAAISIL